MAEALTGRPPGGRAAGAPAAGGAVSAPIRRGAAAALLAVLAACAGADSRRATEAPADQVPEPERYGGTAVVAVGTDQSAFNPLWRFPEGMWVHQGLLSMPLVRYDEEVRPQPWLAERWDTTRASPDTLELTFHLRRDVRWHHGVPTTAEDVRFTSSACSTPRRTSGGEPTSSAGGPLRRWWTPSPCASASCRTPGSSTSGPGSCSSPPAC
jgi:ABC-type transport system substrate-binding protein